MSIEIGWYDDSHRIVFTQYIGQWSWEEFYDIARQAARMIGEESHRVDILADMRKSGPLPINGSALTIAGSVMRLYPENWGCIVIIAENRFVSMLINIFSAVNSAGFGARTCVAKTLDEALDMINERTDLAIHADECASM